MLREGLADSSDGDAEMDIDSESDGDGQSSDQPVAKKGKSAAAPKGARRGKNKK